MGVDSINRGNGVVSDDAHHFLHQVVLDVHVVAPPGYGDNQRIPGLSFVRLRTSGAGEAQRTPKPSALPPGQCPCPATAATARMVSVTVNGASGSGVNVYDAGGATAPPATSCIRSGGAAQGQGAPVRAAAPSRNAAWPPSQAQGRAVSRLLAALKLADSSSTVSVCGPISLLAPPMTPAEADGVLGIGDDQVLGGQVRAPGRPA